MNLPNKVHSLVLPAVRAIDVDHTLGNISQVIKPPRSVEAIIEPIGVEQSSGWKLTPVGENAHPIIVVGKRSNVPEGFGNTIRVSTRLKSTSIEELSKIVSSGKWIAHSQLPPPNDGPPNFATALKEVTESWVDAFSFREESIERGRSGLRSPQLGALHALLAHETVSRETVTVVLPTGIGKTETMLALMVVALYDRLLVIVPTDTLRQQLGSKFATLGKLKEIGVVSQVAKHPLVGLLEHRPKSAEQVDDFFTKCNVVVTTMQILGQCTDEVQEHIAAICPRVFIDEAHHLGAKTWRTVRDRFQKGLVVQFTATPYRNDGEHIGGKVIYNYPLRQAQQEGYFAPIQRRVVTEYEPSLRDSVIADEAVKQLREDLGNGFDHILMARVSSISRAEQVYQIYAKYPEYEPVVIHTGIKDREVPLGKILRRDSRIVVCVDMLGEGFDLPQLKIAAFHDIKKSLPITLQLIGRFTRTSRNLGVPTIVVNLAEVEVQNELQRLYQLDSDWNLLLPLLSGMAIDEQIDLQVLLEGFREFPPDLPILQMRPALSTVIYRTSCADWEPRKVEEYYGDSPSVVKVYFDVNIQKELLVAVVVRERRVEWARALMLAGFDWELVIAYWDRARGLLYVHGSNNDGHYKDIADAVTGDGGATLIDGHPVFRSLAKIDRLLLQNVGLSELIGRLVRFTMRMGSDIDSALSETDKRKARKANLFGVGYEKGRKVSIGCSYKGRIWTRKAANIEIWTKWCDEIGAKVIDESLDPDTILEGTHKSVKISELPSTPMFGIDWNEQFYIDSQFSLDFYIEEKNSEFALVDTDIRLLPSAGKELRFEIRSEHESVIFTIEFFQGENGPDYRVNQLNNEKVTVRFGAKHRDACAFFNEFPPTFWFIDGSWLSGNDYIKINGDYAEYPVSRIETWDWEGTNLRVESQGALKKEDSIQYKVIQYLSQLGRAVIFDDDSSGEVADVVTLNEEDGRIIVEFYHCKFSSKSESGGRISDLYEVCGQAQRSAKWKHEPVKLFTRLLQREAKRTRKGGPSRICAGTINDIAVFREKAHRMTTIFRVAVVQPGLSSGGSSPDQRLVLSATETYLKETGAIGFRVIASE